MEGSKNAAADETSGEDVPKVAAHTYPDYRRMPVIANKAKRKEVWEKLKRENKLKKKKLQKKRKREGESEEGEEAVKQVPKSLDTMREFDETIVEQGDEEVLEDEAIDEMADYFQGLPPKTLITTTPKPSKFLCDFVLELLDAFHNIHYYERHSYELKKIVQYAKNREFTNVLVIREGRKKKPDGMVLIHLPKGPTATFKLSSVALRQQIPDHGRPTEHRPELILTSFNTRLGHTVGRMIASLFPQAPEFRGRQVATFHNQRDYIFYRHHRYIFEDTVETKGTKRRKSKKARLQELGPRFTLKLMSLQHDTFDTAQGEYEWVRKKEIETSRRRFFL
eukprot:TRINITY_DN4600_c0_g1_i1.p1 TRINITY_DN4600_c0_g1~~TRINITY_DN4600_c0_g1_i1.p1  ORF type:complete len:336 (-),score=85.50 TRINITY_DN4600_c0_g1_i1:93-1100(-)